MSFIILKTPFTMLISGGTGSGKTTLVSDMIFNIKEIVDIPPEKIIIVYSQMQPLYEIIASKSSIPVEFIEGLPDDLITPPRTLMILDDLQTSNSKQNIKSWFLAKSHHYETSLIYITQNIFESSKQHRDISLNSHYIVLFKNPRDMSQIRYIAGQMDPNNPKNIIEAYKLATKEPHTYLLLDLRQSTPDYARLRQSIIPGKGVIKTHIFTTDSNFPAETFNLTGK